MLGQPATAMSLFLCCDCGGSKTAVAIADASGNIVGHGVGGPSNFAYQGLSNFVATVKAAVESALCSLPSSHPSVSDIHNAGDSIHLPIKSGGVFAAAWFGVSGVDSLAAVARILPPIGELLGLDPTSTRLHVANDTILLSAPLAEAHLEDPSITSCVAVVGGTGSIAASFRVAKDSGGVLTTKAPEELGRIGGWGWILGDEGGGYHVGREAVRQLLRANELAILRSTTLVDDYPSATSLRARILTHFNVQSPPEILTLLHDPDPTLSDLADVTGKLPPHRLLVKEQRLSKLSPLVFEAAFEEGDSLALEVLRTTANALAEQTEILLLPSSSASPPSTDLRVPAASSLVAFGGSLVGIPAYRDLVLEALRKRGHVFASVTYVSNAAEAGARGAAALFATTKLQEPIHATAG